MTLPIAFAAVKQAASSDETIDRLVRREAARVMTRHQLIGSMIDRIKKVLRMDEAADGSGDDRRS
jgi:CRISPR-associated protein Cas1